MGPSLAAAGGGSGEGEAAELRAALEAAYRMLNSAAEGRKVAEERAKELQVGTPARASFAFKYRGKGSSSGRERLLGLHAVWAIALARLLGCVVLRDSKLSRELMPRGCQSCACMTAGCVQGQLAAEKAARKAAQQQADELAGELKVRGPMGARGAGSCALVCC